MRGVRRTGSTRIPASPSAASWRCARSRAATSTSSSADPAVHPRIDPNYIPRTSATSNAVGRHSRSAAAGEHADLEGAGGERPARGPELKTESRSPITFVPPRRRPGMWSAPADGTDDMAVVDFELAGARSGSCDRFRYSRPYRRPTPTRRRSRLARRAPISCSRRGPDRRARVRLPSKRRCMIDRIEVFVTELPVRLQRTFSSGSYTTGPPKELLGKPVFVKYRRRRRGRLCADQADQPRPVPRPIPCTAWSRRYRTFTVPATSAATSSISRRSPRVSICSPAIRRRGRCSIALHDAMGERRWACRSTS